MSDRRPTSEAYGELERAYDFYNRELFEGLLPRCLITLQRKSRAYGFFSGDRWQAGSNRTDEIAMNPDHIVKGSLREVLSTLVHEMVHLWQHHYGKPGRGRYHNREWAGKMLALGLHPSHTGMKGGNMTGDRMSHYILPEGPFDLATDRLLATGFQLTWLDRYAKRSLPDAVLSQGGYSRVTRQKFSCQLCGLNAWAKYAAPLVCGRCHRRMHPVGLV